MGNNVVFLSWEPTILFYKSVFPIVYFSDFPGIVHVKKRHHGVTLVSYHDFRPVVFISATGDTDFKWICMLGRKSQ